MRTALDIAKYILNKCIELDRPISNLQLQKVLYYVQCEYIKKTNGGILFNDDIVAWDYGPSVPNVYYEYKIYSSSDILYRQENVELDQFDKDIIDPVIVDKSVHSAWKLVEMTHAEKPWINTYNKSKGSLISIKELKSCFIENQRS